MEDLQTQLAIFLESNVEDFALGIGKQLLAGQDPHHPGQLDAHRSKSWTRQPSFVCAMRAVLEWHAGEITSCHATMAEAISLAKELRDMHALAEALCWAAVISYCERDPAEVERYASEFIELSTRSSFAHWRAVGAIYKGWARSASGDTAAGVAWIEDGIRDWLETGAVRLMPVWLSLKTEALYLAGRTPEALEAIKEAVALSEESGEREWYPELQRLRGAFLVALGADETQIEAAFCDAICTAKQQKADSLEKRAQATYPEYHRQKASASGGRGFRLPLW